MIRAIMLCWVYYSDAFKEALINMRKEKRLEGDDKIIAFPKKKLPNSFR